MQITGSPERIESVGDLVVAELADLAANGPTEREFSGAYAQVEEAYGFVNNDSFLEEMLNDAIWPDRELQDYIDQYAHSATSPRTPCRHSSPTTFPPTSTSRSPSCPRWHVNACSWRPRRAG